MDIHYPETTNDNLTIFDAAEEGLCNLVLVAVRYVGRRSAVPAHDKRREAGWPGHAAFQAYGDDDDRRPGSPQFAILPDWFDPDVEEDRTVEAFEADEKFEVYYDQRSIAEALLERNYLPPNVFSRGYDDQVRDVVFDQLDVGYEGTDEATFREELREIAGLEADEEALAEETRDDARVSEYRQAHPRSELATAARILGFDDESESDADRSGIIELSMWLADQDAEAVRFAFDGKVEAARDANAGEDVEVVEPFTPARAVETYGPDELKDAVKAVRESPSEFSLSGATAASMAEWLVDGQGLSEADIDATFDAKSGAHEVIPDLDETVDDEPADEPETDAVWDSDAAEDIWDHDELKAVVKAVRSGPDEFNLRGKSASDMAEWLVETKGLTEAEIDGHLTG